MPPLRRLVVVIALGLLLCAVLPAMPREPRLEDGAIPLVRGFDKLIGTPDYTARCVWQDENTLFTVAAKQGKPVVTRLTLDTGKAETVPVLPPKRTVSRRSGLFFTPDASHLLWLERDPAAPSPTAYALSSDAKPSVISWPGVVYSRRPVFLDGHRWAQISYARGGQEITVYDIENPANVVRLRVSGATDLRDLLTATSDGSLYAYGQTKTGTTTKNRIVRLEVLGNKAVARETVFLPPDKWFMPVNVSQSGRRILWLELEFYKASTGWQRIWEDFADSSGLARILGSPRRLARFWTSTAGGQDMSLLGSEPIDKRKPYQYVARVIWTPDEKHVTYLFGDTLYRRAVP